MKEPGFSITNGKGFQITFDNGVTVSVQFGYGNYCANYHNRYIPEVDGVRHLLHAPNAEIAILKLGGDWLTKECPLLEATDDVYGYATPELLTEVLAWAMEYKG